MKKQPCVYLLASKPHGILYVGVTSNLIARCWQHKTSVTKGFTKTYHVHCLVYYELHATMESAIYKEKQLKKWKRTWKIRLLEIIILAGELYGTTLFEQEMPAKSMQK